jgi:oxygen-dependent protoporphyrinogen oxidase
VRREAGGLFAIDVERLGERFTRRAGAVVLAMPAFEAAALVRSHGDAGAASAEALEAIHYPPVATASVIYRRKDVSHPLDGFGFLAPRIEAPPVLGTLFASSMFAGRAPASTVVLTSFVGGRRNPQAALAPDEHIAADVVRCNAHLLGAEPPLYTAVRRWPRAIPQYDLGHLQRVATVDEFEARVPGLVLCGNWRDGVSVSDCIKAGYKRAEQIAARVSQLPAAASSAGQHRALTAA